MDSVSSQPNVSFLQTVLSSKDITLWLQQNVSNLQENESKTLPFPNDKSIQVNVTKLSPNSFQAIFYKNGKDILHIKASLTPKKDISSEAIHDITPEHIIERVVDLHDGLNEDEKHNLLFEGMQRIFRELEDELKSLPIEETIEKAEKKAFRKNYFKDIIKNQPYLIFTVENPAHPTTGVKYSSYHQYHNDLKQKKIALGDENAEIYKIKGHYGKPERSYLVVNPSDKLKNHIIKEATKYGQDSVLISNGRSHRLYYLQDDNAGKQEYSYSLKFPKKAPKDYYTILPDGTIFVHQFSGRRVALNKPTQNKKPNKKPIKKAEPLMKPNLDTPRGRLERLKSLVTKKAEMPSGAGMAKKPIQPKMPKPAVPPSKTPAASAAKQAQASAMGKVSIPHTPNAPKIKNPSLKPKMPEMPKPQGVNKSENVFYLTKEQLLNKCDHCGKPEFKFNAFGAPVFTPCICFSVINKNEDGLSYQPIEIIQKSKDLYQIKVRGNVYNDLIKTLIFILKRKK